MARKRKGARRGLIAAIEHELGGTKRARRRSARARRVRVRRLAASIRRMRR